MADSRDEGATLQIIGAGFGRTGTTSMKTALEQLGFGPCYHMTELEAQPDDIFAWSDIEHGRRQRGEADGAKLEKVLQDYSATVDWPGARYWKELADTFPDAKVILTVRDFDSWYRSAQTTIWKYSQTVRRKYERFPWLKLLRRRGYAFRVIHEMLWGKTGEFEGQFEDKEAARAIFQRHIEEVKAYISPERLLVYNVSEGWKPLCDFLRVEVPSTPFPKSNTRTEAETWTPVEKVDYVYVGLPIAAVIAGAVMALKRAHKS